MKRCEWCRGKIGSNRGSVKTCSHRCRQAVYRNVTLQQRQVVTQAIDNNTCPVHYGLLDGRGHCMWRGCDYSSEG